MGKYVSTSVFEPFPPGYYQFVELLYTRHRNISWAVARDGYNIFEAIRRAVADGSDTNIEATRVLTQTKMVNTSSYRTALRDQDFDDHTNTVHIMYDILLYLIDEIQFNDKDINMDDRWIELIHRFPEVAIQRWVKQGLDRESAMVAAELEVM